MPLNEVARFCSGCGTPVAQPPVAPVCQQCQTELPEDASFCTECGTPVPKPQAPPVRSEGVTNRSTIQQIGSINIGGAGMMTEGQVDDATRQMQNRGVAYEKLGQYQQAIESYDMALELNPGYAPAYVSRGLACHNLGEHQRAIQDFDKAIQLEPSAKHYTNRGISYGELGQYQRAIEDYDQGIQLDPNDADISHNRGYAYHALGQNAKAAADWAKACSIDSISC